MLVRVLLLCLLPALLTSGWAQARTAPDPELRSVLMATINDSSSFVDRFEAEVWLLDMSNRLRKFVSDDETRLNLLKQVHLEATRAGLEPELVISVIHVESAFKQYAISRVGAQGFMQIMPFWKNEIGRPQDNLMNLETNLRYGCTILKHYIDKEKGNITRGLARYNGSLGRTKYPAKVLKFWEKYWFVRHF